MTYKLSTRPWKDFIKIYAALTIVLRKKDFNVTGSDLARCEQEIQEHAAQQAADEALRAQYREHHAQFLFDSRTRFQNFMQLLLAARAAFRNDPVMLAMLADFKRKTCSHRSTEEKRTPESPPAPPAQGTGVRPTAMA